MARPPTDGTQLLKWYHSNPRALPWRKSRDPYRIWISETMLQQTTSTAVIPYFERFLKKFPTLKSLATAPLPEVLEMWAGLGYYSRARNLHKAAQLLAEMGQFPRTYVELLELPGFGPYTARAVSSLAFDESVGVLDGNVIRVLSRKLGWEVPWWTTNGRKPLQEQADQLAASGPSHEINQALMDLGATVCLPKNPKCILCPWLGRCAAQSQNRTQDFPLKKPKRSRELWQWRPRIMLHKGKIAIVPNNYAPFLKGHWILPGSAKLLQTQPKNYDFRHSITHHDIFVRVENSTLKQKWSGADIKWVNVDKLAQWIPASLVKKAVDHCAQ